MSIRLYDLNKNRLIHPGVMPESGHNNMYCEDSHKEGNREGYDVGCINDMLYHSCGDSCCPGQCTDVGRCPCGCHAGLMPGDRYV